MFQLRDQLRSAGRKGLKKGLAASTERQGLSMEGARTRKALGILLEWADESSIVAVKHPALNHRKARYALGFQHRPPVGELFELVYEQHRPRVGEAVLCG
eukprot:CAMPEP_0180654444 /NCGR_PEP_ID=MMETSP1037_2-20121125/54694_1 /TAXON_ID=632150 /ORGANISM="Azadinium spinosum, Strain 3D9" /LENGTH=99 /DNA_ID=CAMNT_0022680705 /DNA_START=400 /DNA_END=699 /DNA_ORIENTATION=+